MLNYKRKKRVYTRTQRRTSPNMEQKTPKTLESLAGELRELYRSYGYARYKVGRFEEYELYLRNKKFLASEQVLTFSDTNGKLMALKPDITLSIVKNVKADGRTHKVFYTETVYRVPKNAGGFREIPQTGLECIGQVDDYTMAEVLMLAARSLATISSSYSLDVSDIGILSGVLAGEPVGPEDLARVFAVLGEKNAHGLSALASELGLSSKTEQLLKSLMNASGPLEATLDTVERLSLPESCAEPLKSLRRIARSMAAYGIENINLDFSVVNDMDYYSGLIFRGFVEGAPSGVLAGGRYDPLMTRMGKQGEAIGFAVYLDQLERLMEQPPTFDVDALVLYDSETDPAALIREVEALKQRVKSVRVQRESQADVTCREVIRFDGGMLK
ncbi:ATP phosphoribosyltransferase regulatory subunit [bioreactor metagenome]|uniref:ATP phosphoribosyltransferase regulatory subunit n=1 Tax=bioreactor metagenome TaxID=1076179 RepID=A0A644WBL7_9ZZZZ